MKIEYFPETDTLSITFAAGPFTADGEDTADPDVLLLYDRNAHSESKHQLAEIVIEHASERIDLGELRRKISFEEVRSAEVIS